MTRTDTDTAIRALGRSHLADDPEALKTFNRDIAEEFRRNKGHVGGPFQGANVLLLTMTGARSGRPRMTPLEYFTVAGRLLIIGSYGGARNNPAWVHNLRANPRAHIEIGETSYSVVVREVAESEYDAMLSELLVLAPRIGVYQTRTSRKLPIFHVVKA